MRLTRNTLRRGTSLKVLAIAAPMALAASGAQAALTISSGTTQNVTCNAGVCAATARNAVLNVTTLQNLLATSAVKVVSGSKARDITVSAAVTWASANALTLDSYRWLIVSQPVSVAGPGGLALLTNDGGTGGTLSFQGPGNVTFFGLGNSLTINGTAYTLIGDIATLASDIAANPSGNYALAKPFNARSHSYTSAPIPTIFTGKLEGLGNAIANLTINDTTTNDGAGLFAQLGPDSTAPGPTIADLRLLNVNITGQYQTGALAAQSYNAFIFDDSVSGKVTGNGNGSVGGLIANFEWTADNGPSLGVIANARSSATVALTRNASVLVGAGGIAGTVGGTGATVRSSHASGPVSSAAQAYVGGLVGDLVGSTISGSYSTGAVSGDGSSNAGGLLGDAGASSTIDSSYAVGAVTENGNSGSAGGLVGAMFDSTVKNSYAFGSSTAQGAANAGGLVGEDYNGTFQFSYSTGRPVAQAAGGVLGREVGPGPASTDIYWDTTTSGLGIPIGANGNSSGMAGLTTTQLQSGLPAGFNPSIWGEIAGTNGGFPYLLANHHP